ncbi:MAG: aminomethyl-transferring glycine dehydrogenase subunit GcvPB [Bacillota bacterium]
MIKTTPLIFEISRPGRKGADLPDGEKLEGAPERLIPPPYLRERPADLPEATELDVVRHFTGLSSLNYGVDTGFYPLGSCTMKYNPRICEDAAALPGFRDLNPWQDDEDLQGALELLFQMQRFLAEITGMDSVSLQPAAGAHGELTGLKIIGAHFRRRGEERIQILVPDSAHGTNPASAAMNGFEVVEIPSVDGCVDPEVLRKYLSPRVAGLMLTNPNTLGLFERHIAEVAEIVHEAGALLYYDGANANAIMGITRPGDMGFDVAHLNLHKTFAAPHGGGGPGSGPVGVKKDLAPYLPVPVISCQGGKYYRDYDRPLSIGKVHGFFGNFAVAVKAYAYIRRMGASGLKQASLDAVLNANYLKEKLKDDYHLPYPRICMHEAVLSGKNLNEYGIHTLDVAKRLIDYGYHPPTVYFPQIVDEAMMIEPTECESLETMNEFAGVMKKIAREAGESPDLLKEAPHQAPVRRLDETTAARKPVLRWKK